MTSLLKSALIATIFTGFSAGANALCFTPLIDAPDAVYAVLAASPNAAADLAADAKTKALHGATVSVARLHKGRFLPTPHQETKAWSKLSVGSARFMPLPASAHFDVLPGIAQDGAESTNKIDEIRLAAIDAGHDFVLIYATGSGAFWGEFGGQRLEHTGLVVNEASAAHENGDAKAILVQAYSGDVLGAVTTWAPDMDSLTNEVKSMIEAL